MSAFLANFSLTETNGMHLAKETAAGGHKMKKLFATAICLVALIITAMPVGAQDRYRTVNRRSAQNTRTYSRNYDRYQNQRYRNQNYRYEDRSVWDKHRDKITTAGGAAGGAILGGLIGGKKGAIIGAITGGAGAAVYTYKIRDKNRRF
jgi:outer membrane lipoprotein SlyB